ncbi:MAG: hypothetical protein KJI72_03400 [Patescibacteria group bacterium]|nr:hypothetical protein [Patescibacteria group bacterium]
MLELSTVPVLKTLCFSFYNYIVSLNLLKFFSGSLVDCHNIKRKDFKNKIVFSRILKWPYEEGGQLKELHQREEGQLKKLHRKEGGQLRKLHQREGGQLKELHRREGEEGSFYTTRATPPAVMPEG